MEIFYSAWGIVQQFITADAKMPSEVRLPRPAERQVAQYLADRREFEVLDVVDALLPLAQPELLDTQERAADIVLRRAKDFDTGAVLSPIPRTILG